MFWQPAVDERYRFLRRGDCFCHRHLRGSGDLSREVRSYISLSVYLMVLRDRLLDSCVCVCALTATYMWGNSCVQDGLMGSAYLVV